MADNTAKQPTEDESSGVDFSWFTVVPLEDRIVFSSDPAPLPGGGGGSGGGVTLAIPPHANPDGPYTATENITLNVDAVSGVLANDTSGTASSGFVGPLVANLSTLPSNGSLTLNGDGSFVYIPNLGFSGLDSFQYFDSQLNSGNSIPVTVTIDVTNPAAPPTATNDSYFAAENTPLVQDAAGGVLANDSDPDSVNLSAALVQGPANGSLTLNADGSFSYTPNHAFHGSDSFTYNAIDSGGIISNTATVNISVAIANPIANDDSYTLDLGSPSGPILSVDAQNGVLVNDTDPSDLQLVAQYGPGPSHGLLMLNPDGSFAYQANSGFQGIDTFQYRVFDGLTTSSLATVTITVQAPVNQPPVAVNDNFSGNEDTQIAGNVLANDTDIDTAHNLLTASLVAGPAHGALVLNADGSFTYTPAANFNGPDSFTYKANDGALDSGIATVNLTINPVNDPPVAVDDTQVVNMGHSAIVNVLANDSDVDGNALTVTAIVSGPAHGTAVINADNTITYQNDGSNNLSDALTYQISDGQGGFATAIVHFNIIPTVSPPVLVFHGADNQIYIEQHHAVQIVHNVQLTDPNAVNFDGGNLTVSLGENGTLADHLMVIQNGSFFVDATHHLLYKGQIIGLVSGGDNLNPLVISFNNRADARIVGQLISRIGFYDNANDISPLTRRVDFQLNDGAGGISAIASRHIMVRDVNDPPQILSTASQDTINRGDLVNLGAALGIQITDPDNDSSEMYVVTLHVNKGTLSIPDAVLDSLSSVIMTDKIDCHNANGREISFVASLQDTNIIFQNLMYKALGGAKGYTDTLQVSIRDIDFDDFYEHAKTIRQSYSIKVV